MSPAETPSSSSFLITEKEPAHSTATAITERWDLAFITRFNAPERGIVRCQRGARRHTSSVFQNLPAFLALSAVVICVPGPDTALIIRNTLAGGRRSGIASAVGIICGIAVWTLAAAVGLAAVLSASEPVFRALQLVGAAYLVYLGLQSLWAALAGRGKPRPYGDGGARLAPRLSPGPAEQPRQPEDRGLLRQPAPAVRHARTATRRWR